MKSNGTPHLFEIIQIQTSKSETHEAAQSHWGAVEHVRRLVLKIGYD